MKENRGKDYFFLPQTVTMGIAEGLTVGVALKSSIEGHPYSANELFTLFLFTNLYCGIPSAILITTIQFICKPARFFRS